MDQLGAAPNIWIDVEDFFHYFSWNLRPSGIQRLSFELMSALRDELGARVRFVRHAPGLLREVQWTTMEAAYHGRVAVASSSRVVGPSHFRPSRLGRIIDWAPQPLRLPMRQAALQQRQAVRHWRVAARAIRQRRRRVGALGSGSTPIEVGQDDALLVLGAPWEISGHGSLVAACKQQFGFRTYLLLYDLIPIRHPEWCTETAERQFTTWLDASFSLYDGLFAISQHTAADVADYAAEHGQPLRQPIPVLPIGTSLVTLPGEELPTPGLPVPGSYVLIVCTLEARKNHDLAFRVWRQLLDEVRTGRRAAEGVPDLVFAGRVGWMVNDLMQQLDNTGWLGGRVHLITDPSDTELRALYAGCRFTLFPSWFEGLGLPVIESLAFGRPCLASNATAIPEAGGALCRYFAPGDVSGAVRAVGALLDDAAGLAAWEQRIRREFRPVAWTGAVSALLQQVGAGR